MICFQHVRQHVTKRQIILVVFTIRLIQANAYVILKWKFPSELNLLYTAKFTSLWMYESFNFLVNFNKQTNKQNKFPRTCLSVKCFEMKLLTVFLILSKLLGKSNKDECSSSLDRKSNEYISLLSSSSLLLLSLEIQLNLRHTEWIRLNYHLENRKNHAYSRSYQFWN